jgi:molybdate transport system substrate-binding protein
VFELSLARRIAAVALVLGSLPAVAQTLRVAAAADLQPVLPPILAEFEKQTGVHAEASYQASATLTTQIENGAPFDLFLAADFSFPQRLATAGLADAPAPVAYARGTLVLWARKDAPLTALSVKTLADPALKSLAIANPDHAPYGRAAKEALSRLGLADALQSRLVVAENIAQTAQFADSGNAEAGLLSLTSALTPKLQADGRYVEMPRDSYTPIVQGAVVLKRSGSAKDAHRLLDFLLSAPVEKELAEHGLAPPK